MAARVVVSFEGAIVAEVELSRPVTVVGRHPDCDIVIDHPAVSVRHALFRLVNRTVYLEDLASTNGTLVNGVSASSQVLHHLDLVQIGMHKLHYFDDALLAGRVNDLESTVLNEYEHTILAPGAPADPGPVAPRRATGAADDGLSRTMAMPRAPGVGLPPEPEAHPGSGGRLALRVLDGARAGEVVSLERANTMIGTAGADTALVVKRGRALYLARLGGRGGMRLNARSLGPGTHLIVENDRIEVGGETFEVIRVAGPSA